MKNASNSILGTHIPVFLEHWIQVVFGFPSCYEVPSSSEHLGTLPVWRCCVPHAHAQHSAHGAFKAPAAQHVRGPGVDQAAELDKHGMN